MDYIIGIDIGTTNTKGVAFDRSGNEIYKHVITYSLLYPKPDYAEQDPDEIFWAATECIRNVQEYCQSLGTLNAISFSVAMHSLVCVDENGNLLTQVLTWADNRSATEAKILKNSELGMKIYSQTGTPIHAMSPLCKIIWFKNHEPELFKKTYKFIGIKEYFWFKFFEKYQLDFSVASATGLFDFTNFTWNALALETAGIEESLLPELVSVFHIEKIGQNWADALDIPAGTPFVIGGSDGVLANLGAGAIDETSVSVTIGTSGAVRISTHKPLIDKQMRVFCYVLDDQYFVVGGGMNNGGVIADWMQKKLFPAENGEANLSDLMKMAQKVSVGSEGLIFLPYLLGERSPIYDAEAKGVFFGVTMAHSQAHFVRAVLEGIMLAIFSIGKVLFENYPTIEKVYAGGGFAQSAFWVKMLADVFGKKIILAESNENSAFGAVLVAWKALGFIDAFSEISFSPEITIFEPDLEKHKIYQQNFDKFCRIYEKLKDEF